MWGKLVSDLFEFVGSQQRTLSMKFDGTDCEVEGKAIPL